MHKATFSHDGKVVEITVEKSLFADSPMRNGQIDFVLFGRYSDDNERTGEDQQRHETERMFRNSWAFPVTNLGGQYSVADHLIRWQANPWNSHLVVGVVVAPLAMVQNARENAKRLGHAPAIDGADGRIWQEAVRNEVIKAINLELQKFSAFKAGEVYGYEIKSYLESDPEDCDSIEEQGMFDAQFAIEEATSAAKRLLESHLY